MRDPSQPKQTSLRWQSEYTRQFQWRAAGEATPAAQSDASDTTRSDSPESEESFRDDHQKTDSLPNLTRLYSAQARRPHAADPRRRSSDQHITSPDDSGLNTPFSSAPRSIQEEYENIMRQYDSHKRSHTNSYLPSPARSQKGSSIGRPYSPAASHTSDDIYQELEERYQHFKTKSIIVDEIDRKAQGKTKIRQEAPQNNAALRQSKTPQVAFIPGPSQHQRSSRVLKSPPPVSNQSEEGSALFSDVGKGKEPNQDELSKKLLAAKTKLQQRVEAYQTEYQRQFQDWTPAVELKKKQSKALMETTIKSLAGSAVNTRKTGVTVSRDKSTSLVAPVIPVSIVTTDNPQTAKSSNNRISAGVFFTGGEPDRNPHSVAKSIKLNPTDLPAAGIKSGQKMGGVSQIFTEAENSMNVAGGELPNSSSRIDTERKNRILQFALEPPPTWNLAQEILHRARLRRNQVPL
ncbi:hypothetical protein BDR26DRAFT_852007 [Obelidium mucronatum]|nr:hypothetical protein BDR26DRAFT_852007 [Obelidium mucronatum]